MKKSPSKHPVRQAKAKLKRVVRQAARRPVKLTQTGATHALRDLKAAVAALKPTAKGGAKQGAATRVKRALGVATKLNRLVKSMNKAGLLQAGPAK
jgi:hypothetical protein